MKKIIIPFIFLILLPLFLLLSFIGDSNNYIGVIFFIIMFLLSMIVVGYRVFCDRNTLQEINFLTQSIDVFKSNVSKSDFNILKDKLNGRFNRINDIWISFINSFYETDDKLTQVVDAEYFFNKDTLLKDRMNYKLLNYIPQGLVGLGLLGTFLGLTIGLSSINLEDKSTINESIITLISGTKVSFSTSLYGMYFSIVFSFFLNFYIGFYEKKIIILKNKLNLIFPKSNEDEKFDNLKRGISDIVVSSKDMAENIANQIESLENSNKGKFDNLNEKMSGIIISNGFMGDKIGNNIRSGIESIDDSNKEMTREVVETINDKIGKLAESLGGGFQDSIGESLEKIFTIDFIEKFENIKDELISISLKNNEFISNYSDKISDINNYSESIKSDYQKLSIEISYKFHELSNRILNDYSEMDNAYSDFMDLTKEINSIQKENKEYLGEFQQFSEKSFQIINSLDNFIEAENNVINVWKQYENSFSDLGDKLENNLISYNKVLDRTSNTYQELINSGVLSYNNLLDKTSTEYQNLIREGVDEYTDKLKKGVFSLFKDYDNNLTKVVEEFNKVIKHLSEKLSSSDSILSEHTKVLNRNEEQISKLNILLNERNIDR